MRLEVLTDIQASPNGIHIFDYAEGEVYLVNDNPGSRMTYQLAEVFKSNGWGMETPEQVSDGKLDNQSGSTDDDGKGNGEPPVDPPPPDPSGSDNSFDVDTMEVIGYCSVVPASEDEEHMFGDVVYTYVREEEGKLLFAKKVEIPDPEPEEDALALLDKMSKKNKGK